MNSKGSDVMGVQEEIFEEFFNKLEAAKLPAKVIMGLKKLLESNNLPSQEDMMRILKEAVEDAKYQGN